MANQTIPRVFSRDEAESLLDQLNERYFAPFRNKALIALALRTGLRNAEVRHLKEGDLDLEAGRLVVRSEGAKGGRERTLWFPEKTARLLRGWMQRRDEEVDVPTDLVFCTRHGTMVDGSYLRKMVKRYAEKAGLPNVSSVNFHLLRHTALTWTYQRTHDLELCRRMAGHSQISTTQRYVTIADHELETAMKEEDDEDEENSIISSWSEQGAAAAGFVA